MRCCAVLFQQDCINDILDGMSGVQHDKQGSIAIYLTRFLDTFDCHSNRCTKQGRHPGDLLEAYSIIVLSCAGAAQILMTFFFKQFHVRHLTQEANDYAVQISDDEP